MYVKHSPFSEKCKTITCKSSIYWSKDFGRQIMKNSVHSSIMQFLSKLFLATYNSEKDELFGKKEQNLSLKSRGNFRLFLFFNAVLRDYRF